MHRCASLPWALTLMLCANAALAAGHATSLVPRQASAQIGAGPDMLHARSPTQQILAIGCTRSWSPQFEAFLSCREAFM